MTGMKVAQALEQVKGERGALPASITVDNGSEFGSRALEAWVMGNDVQLCLIRPGRPVENGFIESFNGRLRDECLNVECRSRSYRGELRVRLIHGWGAHPRAS
jgi:putative transposase